MLFSVNVLPRFGRFKNDGDGNTNGEDDDDDSGGDDDSDGDGGDDATRVVQDPVLLRRIFRSRAELIALFLVPTMPLAWRTE